MPVFRTCDSCGKPNELNNLNTASVQFNKSEKSKFWQDQQMKQFTTDEIERHLCLDCRKEIAIMITKSDDPILYDLQKKREKE